MQKSQNQSLDLITDDLKSRGVIDVKITLSEDALSYRSIDQIKNDVAEFLNRYLESTSPDSSINYYEQNATKFFCDTIHIDMSHIYDRFFEHLNYGDRVLDAGCGSGRDTKKFSEVGLRVTAFDASASLARLATHYSGVPVEVMQFSDVSVIDPYDGIWACASLLHLSDQDLKIALQKLWNALKPNGIFYMSFKHGNESSIVNGRFFNNQTPQSIMKVFGESISDIDAADYWITKDSRLDNNQEWLNIILRKSK